MDPNRDQSASRGDDTNQRDHSVNLPTRDESEKGQQRTKDRGDHPWPELNTRAFVDDGNPEIATAGL
jgi:hypothetical protein